MVFDAKEKTALATSVGADERQSVQNTNNIVPTTDEHFNDTDEIYEENLIDLDAFGGSTVNRSATVATVATVKTIPPKSPSQSSQSSLSLRK